MSLEPGPLAPGAPRYCPWRPLPLARYIPGRTPRPASGGEPGEAALPAPGRWRECEEYLYGIDLYHQGFCWEAHEAWERLWLLAARDSAQKFYLQSLILIAAAALKLWQNCPAGAVKLSRLAQERLARVERAGAPDEDGRFMGAPVRDLREQVERYFGPLWESGGALSGEPPWICLL